MRCLISGTAGRRFRQVDGHADHLRARLGQLDALPRRAVGIRRVGHRHRLDDDRRAAADLDGSDANADCPVKFEHCHVDNLLIIASSAAFAVRPRSTARLRFCNPPRSLAAAVLRGPGPAADGVRRL